MDVLSQRETANSTSSAFFVIFRSSMDIMKPTCIGEGESSLLSLQIQLLISSGNTLTDIPRNNILLAIWIFLTYIKLIIREPLVMLPCNIMSDTFLYWILRSLESNDSSFYPFPLDLDVSWGSGNVSWLMR